MQLFTRDVTGIDIGSRYIKVVHLRGPMITAYGATACPSPIWDAAGNLVDPPAATELVKNLARELGIQGGPAVTGLSGQRSLIRTLELPLMPESELEQALRWQAEEFMPFPLAEAAVDFTVVRRDRQARKQVVLVAAGPKTLVQALRNVLRSAGFRPLAVETEALALCRSVERLRGPGLEKQVYGILDVGLRSSSLVLAEGSFPLSSREIPTGIERLRGGRQDSQADDLHAADLTAPELRNFLSEIYRNLRYFAQQPGGTPVKTIFLSGGAAEWPGLAEAITSSLGVECRKLELTPVLGEKPRSWGDLSLAACFIAYGYAAWKQKAKDDAYGKA